MVNKYAKAYDHLHKGRVQLIEAVRGHLTFTIGPKCPVCDEYRPAKYFIPDPDWESQEGEDNPMLTPCCKASPVYHTIFRSPSIVWRCTAINHKGYCCVLANKGVICSHVIACQKWLECEDLKEE